MEKVLDRTKAHPKAQKLIPDGFFWSCVDEDAPFGSDEGYTALLEYRKWRDENPKATSHSCIVLVINSVGNMSTAEYLQKVFDEDKGLKTLNISIISTGFAQIIDEGKIDRMALKYVSKAILLEQYNSDDDYERKLLFLKKILFKFL